MTASNKMYRYHFLAILTVIIWGTTFVSTKVLIGNGLTPVEILLYRFSLAYIGIWFFCPRKLLANSWKDELLFLGAGLCGGSLMALLGVALVVFIGCFILQINPLGDVLTLIAALMWAFYGLILRRLGGRYPTLFITRKVFFYGIVTLIPVLVISPIHPQIAVLTQPSVICNLLFLGIIASLLCYIMWNTAVKELGVVRTTNYIYVVPLVTLLTSALVIDETITVVALFGSVFILSGVYMAERGITFLKK